MKKKKYPNKRDRKGWRVPREGTLSREIYDRINEGIPMKDIADTLQVERSMVYVLAHRFKNWRWSNNRRSA